VLNRIESTEFSPATNFVYTHEYPITLPMVGIDQLSRHNARPSQVSEFAELFDDSIFNSRIMLLSLDCH